MLNHLDASVARPLVPLKRIASVCMDQLHLHAGAG